MTKPSESVQPRRRWRPLALLLAGGLPLTLGVAGAVELGAQSPAPEPEVQGQAQITPGVEAKVRMTGFVTEAPTREMCALLGGQIEPGTSDCIISMDAESCRARGVPVRSDNTCSLPAGPCDVRDTQLGRCVDIASFRDPQTPVPAHSGPTLDAELSRAYWSNLGHLTTRLLDDIAQRWGRKKDALSEALLGFGITTLPSAASLWGITANSTEVYAVPDPAVWLGESDWVAVSGSKSSSDSIFQPVSALIPAAISGATDAQTAFPDTVLMRGRFGSGLTHNGILMPYDLLDADPAASVPFLRQFFPYPTSKTTRSDEESMSCKDREIPLACFDSNTIRIQNYTEESSYRSVAATGQLSAREVSAEKAHEEFRRFADLIGERLLQYGRREASSTHTRIIAALIAMTSPPNLTPSGRVQPAGTNPSTPTQTDLNLPGDSEEPGAPQGDSAFWMPAQPGDGRVDYRSVPDEVVRASLDELGLDQARNQTLRCLQSGPSDDAWLVQVVSVVRETQLNSSPLLDDEAWAKAELSQLDELNNRKAPLKPTEQSRQQALSGVDAANRATVAFFRVLREGSDSDIRAILNEHAIENRRDKLNRDLDRLVLMRAVEDACLLADDPGKSANADDPGASRLRSRGKNRSRILMKQVELRLRESLPDSSAGPATPQEMSDRAREAWTEVLSMHGPPPDPGQELPGNINPVAVCVDPAKLSAYNTPAARRDAALADPVFKRIHVDALIVAPKGLSGQDALWHARGSLPFVFLDDPEMNNPRVEPLIAISATHEIYRARWEVWTGWHLLWGVTPPGDRRGTGADRLDLRVGALCDDMVFAPEPLLPTLVRAGLLEGAMRGTTPATRSEAGPAPQPLSAPSPDAFVASTSQGVERAQDAASEAIVARETVTSNPTAIVGQSGQAALSAASTPPAPGEAPGDEPPPSPVDQLVQDRLRAVEYLRALILTPLRALEDGQPFLMFTFDTVTTAEHRATDGLRPHSPYRHRQVRVGPELWSRSAAWATLIRPDPTPEQPPTPDAPFREPSVPVELALGGIVRPTWRRTHPVDFTLVTDWGFSPQRAVQPDCKEPDPEHVGMVASCGRLSDGQPGDPDSPILSTDHTLGLGSLATLWLLDSPHVAAEFGAFVQLGVLPAGEPWGGRRPAYASIPYSWDIAPRFGVLVGARWAPDPLGLHRALPRKKSSDDGAESGANPEQSKLRMPWGADGADGSSHLRRMQLGVRGGFGLEPLAYDGPAYIVGGETWLAWSLRNNRTSWANMTPYRPNLLLGPYVQWQRTAPWPFAEPSTSYFSLEHSHQVTVGLRVQLRLSQNTVKVPEAP